MLLLAWYGVAASVGLMAVCFLPVFAGSLGERLAGALGGSLPAKVAGFIVTFVVLLGLEVGFGAALGLAYVVFAQRWPNNPVERLVKWVKAVPTLARSR